MHDAAGLTERVPMPGGPSSKLLRLLTNAHTTKIPTTRSQHTYTLPTLHFIFVMLVFLTQKNILTKL